MGFTFKGLTSSALVSGNTASANADNKDIADVPASVQGHTSMDVRRPDEKLGSPRGESATSDYSDDDDVNKIDTAAEHGVLAVQAASSIWKKEHLIMAYVLLVYLLVDTFYQTNSNQHVAPPVLHDIRFQHIQYPCALRYQLFPTALADRIDERHLVHRLRYLEAPLR